MTPDVSPILLSSSYTFKRTGSTFYHFPAIKSDDTLGATYNLQLNNTSLQNHIWGNTYTYVNVDIFYQILFCLDDDCPLISEPEEYGPDKNSEQNFILREDFSKYQFYLFYKPGSIYDGGIFYYQDYNNKTSKNIFFDCINFELGNGENSISLYDFFLPDSTFISYYILGFSVSGMGSCHILLLDQLILADFPLQQNYSSSNFSQVIDNFYYPINQFDRSMYSTMIYRMYFYNPRADMIFKLQITFSGIIRAVYLDENELILYGSSPVNSLITLETPQYRSLNSSKMMIITIFGVELNISSINFIDESGSEVFFDYLIQNYDPGFKGTLYYTSSSQCPQNCKTCSSDTYCITCKQGFLVENGSCYQRNICSQYKKSPIPVCMPNQNLAYLTSIWDDSESNNFFYFGFILDIYVGTLSTEFLFVVSDIKCGESVNTPKLVCSSNDRTITQNNFIKMSSPLLKISTIEIVVASFVFPLNYTGYLKLFLYTIYPNLFEINIYEDETFLRSKDFFLRSTIDQSLFVNNKYIEISFFLPNNGNSYFFLEFEGYLKIISKESSIFFEGNFTQRTKYKLSRPIAGSIFSFQGVDLKFFNLSISGNNSIYARNHLVYRETVSYNLTGQNCTIENCIICFRMKCFECENGFYLTADGLQCLQNCTSPYVSKLEKYCPSNCDDPPYIRFDGKYCSPYCLEGLYFNYTTSTCQNCSEGCEICHGLSILECYQCTSQRIHIDGECLCAYIVNGSCTPNCSVEILGPNSISKCSDQYLQIVSSDCLLLQDSGYHVDWNLTSSNSNESSLQLLSFLQTQSSMNIIIPSSYLASGANYTIQATISRQSAVTQSYNFSFYVKDDSMGLAIDGEPLIEIDPTKEFRLQSIPLYSNCIKPSDVITNNWKILSNGTWKDLSATGSDQFTYTIEANSLKVNSSLFKSQVTQNGQIIAEKEITVRYKLENFIARIVNDSSIVSKNDGLILAGAIIYESEYQGDSNAIIDYSWGCQNFSSASKECFSASYENSGSFSFYQIPSSILNVNDQLEINLSVTKGLITKNTSKLVSVRSSGIIQIEIICEGNHYSPYCTYYQSSIDNYVQGVFSNHDQISSFNWSIIPNIPFYSFLDKIKIPSNSIHTDSLNIQLEVEDSTGRKGIANITMPIPTLKSSGFIRVNPPTGYSMSTNFYIETYGWDSDNLPIIYTFYWSQDSNNSYLQLSQSQLKTFTYQYFFSTYPYSEISIMLKATDYLNAQGYAYENITVFQSLEDLPSLIQQLGSRLSNISYSYPAYKLQASVYIGQELNFLIDKLQSDIENKFSCPLCSGFGKCLDTNVCTCDLDYTLPDCSMLISEYEKIINTTLKILTNIEETYQPYDDVQRTLVFNYLDKLSNSYYLNSNSTYAKMQDILQNNLQIQNKTLTSTETNQITNILSNMIEYSIYYDCPKLTIFSQNLINKTQDYIDIIIKSTQDSQITNENASVYSYANLGIYQRKVTECLANNLSISIATDSPGLVLNSKNSTILNCTNELSVSYIAFSNRIFNCSAEKNSGKNVVAVSLLDTDTGASFAQSFEANLIMPPGFNCPSGCLQSGDIIKFCKCENLMIFDIKGQLLSLFQNSNLNKINFDGFKNWKPWTDGTFYCILALSIWLAWTFYMISKKYADLCVIKKFNHNIVKTSGTKVLYTFLVVHPFVQIYALKDPLLTKNRYALLFYMREILALTFTSLFITSDNKTIGNFLNPYLLLMPYTTFIPIYLIFKAIFTENPQKKTNTKQTKQIKPPPKSLKLKIAELLAASIVFGCIILIFIISSNQTNTERSNWMIQFGKVMGQDILIAPIIDFILQIISIKFFGPKELIDSKRKKKLILKLHQKIANSFLDENVKRLYMLEKKTRNVTSRIKKIHVINKVTVLQDGFELNSENISNSNS